MFTLNEIKAAHSKVKSGADFPAYIRDIKKLGVAYYETFVSDGHTDYYDDNGNKTTSPARYDMLTIAELADTHQFAINLKDHQQGKSDYPTFSRIAANMGVDKWAVSLQRMTCTYYDKAGNEMLIEEVPQA